MRFGLGIGAPFGLKTSYDPNWVGRFQAINSKIETVNLNPSVSYQVNETVSVGAGLSYQHITGELSQAVNYSALLAPFISFTPPGLEGVSTVSGSDSKLGYNLGALINLDAQTRIGLAYRSKIKYNLTGTVSFTNVPLIFGKPIVANGAISLDVTMPDSCSVSGVHQINQKIDVSADLSWTGWAKFNQLNVMRSDGTLLSSTPENWKNTWRTSVGSNYHYNEQWTSRIGIAYDQSPVSDTYRTARIPDANRTWLALGGQYKASRTSAVDFGYAHLFVSSAAINQNQTALGAGILSGSYSISVNILSVQYTQDF